MKLLAGSPKSLWVSYRNQKSSPSAAPLWACAIPNKVKGSHVGSVKLVFPMRSIKPSGQNHSLSFTLLWIESSWNFFFLLKVQIIKHLPQQHISCKLTSPRQVRNKDWHCPFMLKPITIAVPRSKLPL